MILNDLERLKCIRSHR